ncbi:hypothetical protein [Nocardia sp. NPDC059229]|uniref:hypothetical protein n=1 Tax=Nocardia sp. NPDC059229 TaxID=3346778 RepID=UPI0036BAC50E
MAIAEVDQALARLDADHGEIAANLAEPEDDPGVRFLDGVPLTGASATRDNALALLDRRDELRVRVDAYRVKGARLRLSEDPAVDARYRRAYELLHSAPCDLAAATRAVAEYQRAITEKTA